MTTTSSLVESTLDPADATLLDVEIAAGDGWTGILPAGSRFRIVDLHGNQAVDTLFYDAHDYANRYSAVDTIREQGAVYLTTGSTLVSTRLDPLVTITADTCGRHDTIGGACAQESNVVRYGPQVRFQHACRQTFLTQAREWEILTGRRFEKRDVTHNVNFFMNVPVSADGGLTFADGVSAPGKYVEMRAERDVLVLLSNCPQLNNPCNGYNPTPARLLGWAP
jgi:urea carboxylase-associated protein 1